jgi:hypothetical protein
MSVWKRKKQQIERLRNMKRKIRGWTIERTKDIVFQYGVGLIEEITAAIIADVERTRNG